MSALKAGPESTQEPKLPSRDWIILPLLSLLTICFLAVSTESIARLVFSESKTGVGSCIVKDDPSTGARGIPNSVCWEKNPESQWIEYRFNSCGHRAGMECGPKPPDTFRIVMIGSSIALGERVQREKTFAALLPAELSRETGKKVELYNESMGWGFSHSTTLRFNSVLGANPDMILWILAPMDIERTSLVLPTADLDPYASLSLRAKAWRRAKDELAANSIAVVASNIFGRTRTALLLRHFLYKSQSQYLKASLVAPDTNMGYLKSELSEEWKTRLIAFDADAGVIEGQAKTAGVPFVATFLPERAQAAMISRGDWPAGYDPCNLDTEIGSIITRHGGTYVDILPAFRNIPNPEQYYLPVDGHPDAGAHAIFARLLAGELANGAVPELQAASHPKFAQKQGR